MTAAGSSSPSVPPGEYVLRVSTVGYRIIKKPFSMAAGDVKEFDVTLSPDTFRKTETVVVDAGPFDLVRQESPSQLTLTGTEAKNLAGVLADDPLRAVQSMPGVVSNDDFNSRFSIRGADYNRVGLYLDDILMHQPFHQVENTSGTGSLTIFNGDMLEALELYPGAPPPRLDDRTAGALDVHTREGSRTGTSFRISAGAGDAGALAEGPLGEEASGIVAGGGAQKLSAIYSQPRHHRPVDCVRLLRYAGPAHLRSQPQQQYQPQPDRRLLGPGPLQRQGEAGPELDHERGISFHAGQPGLALFAEREVPGDHARRLPAGEIERCQPQRAAAGQRLLRRMGGADERHLDVGQARAARIRRRGPPAARQHVDRTIQFAARCTASWTATAAAG